MKNRTESEFGARRWVCPKHITKMLISLGKHWGIFSLLFSSIVMNIGVLRTRHQLTAEDTEDKTKGSGVSFNFETLLTMAVQSCPSYIA